MAKITPFSQPVNEGELPNNLIFNRLDSADQTQKTLDLIPIESTDELK